MSNIIFLQLSRHIEESQNSCAIAEALIGQCLQPSAVTDTSPQW